MLVIFQVHAEFSARASVAEIWIESALLSSTDISGSELREARAENPCLDSKNLGKSRFSNLAHIRAGENETLKKSGVGSGGTLSSAPEKWDSTLQIRGLGL